MMITLTTPKKIAKESVSNETIIPTKYAAIRSYYNHAGPDYAAWSKNFNMHFGYCKKWTDCFSLEQMLVRMNEMVIDKLAITPTKKVQIADLGCGVGAVARYTIKKYPQASIKAITLSDYQIKKGTTLNAEANCAKAVTMVKDNFENLHFDNASFDYAYALESACHSHYDDKKLFIAEMARILKEGGSFCIADGFLKHDKKLPWLFNWLYKKIIDCWALPCFGNIEKFTDTLKKYNLVDVEVKEISWQIAPSVLYVPWTCIKFFAKELWKNKSLKMNKERWNNVYAPLMGMVLGMHRKHFGYYMISGKKGKLLS
jgi:MPBQ/MSBQ methyltransferase